MKIEFREAIHWMHFHQETETIFKAIEGFAEKHMQCWLDGTITEYQNWLTSKKNQNSPNSGARLADFNYFLSKFRKYGYIEVTDIRLILALLKIDKKQYTINKNGEVDVDGDVHFSNCGRLEIPVKFGTVTGNYEIMFNRFKSLKEGGCPRHVGGNLVCMECLELISLDGIPETIGEGFIYQVTPIASYLRQKEGDDYDSIDIYQHINKYPELLRGITMGDNDMKYLASINKHEEMLRAM